jgi:hypothetical protein
MQYSANEIALIQNNMKKKPGGALVLQFLGTENQPARK